MEFHFTGLSPMGQRMGLSLDDNYPSKRFEDSQDNSDFHFPFCKLIPGECRDRQWNCPFDGFRNKNRILAIRNMASQEIPR
jgi:hypothetical protein